MSPTDRQRIERVPGARRAKLTPAPGTAAEPVPADERADDSAAGAPAGGASAGGAAAGASAASAGQQRGPNDEQLRRDVPPHY